MDFHVLLGRFSAKDHLFFFAFASLLESAILSAIAAVFLVWCSCLACLLGTTYMHHSIKKEKTYMHLAKKLPEPRVCLRKRKKRRKDRNKEINHSGCLC